MENLNKFVNDNVGILTIFGILIGLIPFALEYKKNINLVRKQKEDVWKQIEQLKAIIRGLEQTPLSKGGRVKSCISREELDNLLINSKHNYTDYEVITMVEMKLLSEFRNLLQIAISLESNYSLETIAKWQKVGKLSSNWQVRQACQLLDTKNISEKHLEKYKELLENCKASIADETNI